MKKWLVFLCSAFLLASWFTTGLARSLIEFSAFVAILTLVWRHSGSDKVEDIEQGACTNSKPKQ